MNLENFPTSESAKRMLGYVNEDFYEKSYIGKWIYQVIGMEIDDIFEKIEELRLQIFPETATWGLIYHEQKYGIESNRLLTLKERRNRILQRRDVKSPMNPAHLEQIIKGMTGVDVSVIENVTAYTFEVDIDTTSNKNELNYSELIEVIKRKKPSHLSFRAYFSIKTELKILIETLAIPKWPHMAGESFCGTIPNQVYSVVGLNEHLILNEEISHCNLNVDYAGTKPQINTSLADNEINISKIVDGLYMDIYSPFTNDTLAGEIPIQYIQKNEEATLVETFSTNHINKRSVIAGDSAISGTEPNLTVEAKGIDKNGLSTSVDGKGISVIYRMCGDEGGVI